MTRPLWKKAVGQEITSPNPGVRDSASKSAKTPATASDEMARADHPQSSRRAVAVETASAKPGGGAGAGRVSGMGINMHRHHVDDDAGDAHVNP